MPHSRDPRCHWPKGPRTIGKQAYSEGKGLVRVRAKTHFEGDEKKKIIVTELPYQVNKSNLLKTIADLVKSKKIGFGKNEILT